MVVKNCLDIFLCSPKQKQKFCAQSINNTVQKIFYKLNPTALPGNRSSSHYNATKGLDRLVSHHCIKPSALSSQYYQEKEQTKENFNNATRTKQDQHHRKKATAAFTRPSK